MAWVISISDVEDQDTEQARSGLSAVSRWVAVVGGIVGLLAGAYVGLAHSLPAGLLVGFGGVIALPRTRRAFERVVEIQVEQHEDRQVRAALSRGFVVVVTGMFWLVGAAAIPPG